MIQDQLAIPEVNLKTQTILLAASKHDLVTLKTFLKTPGNASVQDPETGFTPLHAAIAACGPATPTERSPSEIKSSCTEHEMSAAQEQDEQWGDVAKAKKVVHELFLSGAIWNDVDTNNRTSGCLAYELRQMELYELCVEAGVRAELLLALMGGYEELSSGDEGEEGEDEQQGEEAEDVETNTIQEPVTEGPKDVNSADFLASALIFEGTKLLDADKNGVMMSWETPIMRKTVDLLIPDLRAGARVLNIGFGMGIIDSMFCATKPLTHHIIEAHPSVLSSLSSPNSNFSHAWQTSAPPGGRYVIHAGKWQDIAPQLLQEGEAFDAIYFDTYAEDYSQLRFFFEELIPGLLAPDGRFGFFNGLGADRRVVYDVYCRVFEFHAHEAGLEVEWTDVNVDLQGEADGNKGLANEGQGEWEGVRRRYWVLDKYRLPILRFVG